MAETFRALFQRVDVRPLADGLAGIFNAEAADARRTFEVIRVAVRPSSAQGALSGTAALGAKLSLYRITNVIGGEVVTPIKRDPAAADLPAEVECRIMPNEVTTSGAALRTIVDAPSLSLTGSNTWLSARVYGGPGRGFNADLVNLGSDANVERIVLREGEGLALVLDSYGWARAGQINLTVRNEATGATYQFRSRAIGHPERLGQGLISLFNTLTSGVVVGVTMSQYPNDGESNLPGVRLARIDSMSGGDAVVPFAADPAVSAPAALQCMAGDFDTQLAGQTLGVPYDWNVTHGASMSVLNQQKSGAFGFRTGGARQFPALGLTPGLGAGQEDHVVFQARAGAGIVLGPREGVALLAGRGGALETSTFAYMDVEVTVLHYPPPAGGGTFPAEDDVRSGVVYGPTDNLSGDLVVPGVGDVRLGVGYGADGTEFTGTLAGGGGSGSFLSRRGR